MGSSSATRCASPSLGQSHSEAIGCVVEGVPSALLLTKRRSRASWPDVPRWCQLVDAAQGG